MATKNYKIYPYNGSSASARRLSNALDWRRIRRTNSKFEGNDPDITVLNWGCSNLPEHVKACRVINRPAEVKTSSNKRRFMRFIAATSAGEFLPPWTEDVEVAIDWLVSGKSVVSRTKLTGHSGEGIYITSPEDLDGGLHPYDVLEPAPLYTKYMPKKEEYRVHIVGNEVIDIAQKKRRLEVPDEEVDWRVRSHSNGFVYAREGITVHSKVLEAATATMQATGLDFGAVDVIWNEQHQRATVLEINTAPGLEGQTVHKYATALKDY